MELNSRLHDTKADSETGWLVFAAEVRVELDKMHIRKSEKPFERRILSRYKEVCASKGYEGSLAIWQFLLHKLGQNGRRAGVLAIQTLITPNG